MQTILVPRVGTPSTPGRRVPLERAVKWYADNLERLKLDFKNNRSSYDQKENAIARYELNALNTMTTCNGLTKAPDGRPNLTEFVRLLENQFYNAAVMKASFCYVSALNGAFDEAKDSFGIRSMLTGDLVVAGKGSNGLAMRPAPISQEGKGDFKGDSKGDIKNVLGREAAPPSGGSAIGATDGPLVSASKTVIVKTSSANLTHEYYVGTRLNDIRESDLGFAYMIGAFSCLAPYIAADGKTVLSYCASDDVKEKQPYLIYENIPGQPIRDHIRSATPEQILCYYLQAMCSLAVANRKMRFSHGDCNDSNIILRPVQAGSVIGHEALVDGKLVVLKFRSDYIPTFIDYGLSHVEATTSDGKRLALGPVGFDYAGIPADTDYPMHDAYKLLLHLGYTAIQAQRKDVYEVLNRVYLFFDPQTTLEAAAKALMNNYFAPPPVSDFTDIRYETLIEYIIGSMPDVVSKFMVPDNVRESYTCQEDKCVTLDGAWAAMWSTRPKTFSTDQLYQYIRAYESDSNINRRPENKTDREGADILIRRLDTLYVIQYIYRVLARAYRSDPSVFSVSDAKTSGAATSVTTGTSTTGTARLNPADEMFTAFVRRQRSSISADLASANVYPFKPDAKGLIAAVKRSFGYPT